MGLARAACLASAVVVAGIAAESAGGVRARQQGVHVAAVVTVADDDLASMTNPNPPYLFFEPGGDVIAVYGNPAVRRRIAADGTTSVATIPELRGLKCVDPGGSVYALVRLADGSTRLARVGPDDAVMSEPIDPGGSVAATAARDGRLYVLTVRFLPDRSVWLQRFLPDGTPDSPAVRVTPSDGPSPYAGATVDVDATGSAYVLWESATIDDRFPTQTHDHAVNWTRVDGDGSVTAAVRLFSSTYDTDPIYSWQRHLAADGTMWVQPELDGRTDARGPIGIRRDAVVLPVIDLHAEFDASTDGFGMSTFGVDAAGEVRTLLLPFGFVEPVDPLLRTWRPRWQEFRANATPLRTHRLVEPSGLRRKLTRSGVWVQQMEVAPDGSSLVAIVRREDTDRFSASTPGVVEFLHLGPDGRVLSHGSFPTAFQPDRPNIASAVVAGRPRFALTWTGRTTADGSITAFVAILE